MIKKLSLALMLSLPSVNAMTFEETPAYDMATPLYRTVHRIIEQLPPIEMVMPRNASVFDAWYLNCLEENFHNLVTRKLELRVVDYLAQGMALVDSDEINQHIIPIRSVLMAECFTSAYTESRAVRLRQLDNDVFFARSPYAGALLVLRHYQEREMSDSSDVYDSPMPTAVSASSYDGIDEEIVAVEEMYSEEDIT